MKMLLLNALGIIAIFVCIIAEGNDAARVRHRRSLCGGKPYDVGSLCCVDKLYSEDHQLCCDGNILPKVSGSVRNSCCGPVAYDNQHFVCCAKTLNHIRDGMFCCGKKNYNNLHQKCEQGMIIPMNTNFGYIG
ncbi:galaxin-2-like [Xenia sp. Carnegie-2017]|uniref:galaxin-2-like n=1 Tax=Xenia sp. Carnegie-2017 TaxID=2897299 RepID=UPI001F033343|nr:galaxin-2-like [Xenia sp. Carnegie-2017]